MKEKREAIIKKAVDGGFKYTNTDPWAFKLSVLATDFWQALNIACKWRENGLSTMAIALKFYEINITENFESAVDYLNKNIK